MKKALGNVVVRAEVSDRRQHDGDVPASSRGRQGNPRASSSTEVASSGARLLRRFSFKGGPPPPPELKNHRGSPCCDAEQASIADGARSTEFRGSAHLGSAHESFAARHSSRLRRVSVSLSPSSLRAKLRAATTARDLEPPIPAKIPLPAASSPPRQSFRRRVSLSLSPSTARSRKASATHPRRREEPTMPAHKVDAPTNTPTDQQSTTPPQQQSPPSPTSNRIRRRLSVSIDYTRMHLNFARATANPSHSATIRDAPGPPPTSWLQRRRDSVSLSPTSLRAALRHVTDHVSKQGGDDRAEDIGTTNATAAASGAMPKKSHRGRSMSFAFMGRGGLNISAPPSPTALSARGSRSPGFRGRLRQRRSGSISPNHRGADWDAGALIGEAGGWSGWRIQGGVPSLLDTVPAWKRPKLLKDLRKRRAEFTTVKGVGVFCGTWNVNAKRPDCPDPWWLEEWLCPRRDEVAGKTSPRDDNAGGSCSSKQEGGGDDDGMEDLYAIGLQELVDLNAVNVAIDTKSQKRSQEWAARVLSTLNLLALRGKARARVSCGASRVSRAQPPLPRADCAASVTAVTDATGEESETGRPRNENTVLGTESAPAAASAQGAMGVRSDDGIRRLSAGESDQRGVDETTIDDSDGARDEGQEEGGEEQREEEQRSGKGSTDGDGPTFVIVAKEHLVGTWMAVFIRASMVPHVSDVRSGTVSAGVMGVMGNKGGVGIRLSLRNSSLCFVCSHLAAHRENVRARNDNYLKILRDMNFAPRGVLALRAQQRQQQQSRVSPPASPGSGRGSNGSPSSPPEIGRAGQATSRSLSPRRSRGAYQFQLDKQQRYRRRRQKSMGVSPFRTGQPRDQQTAPIMRRSSSFSFRNRRSSDPKLTAATTDVTPATRAFLPINRRGLQAEDPAAVGSSSLLARCLSSSAILDQTTSVTIDGATKPTVVGDEISEANNSSTRTRGGKNVNHRDEDSGIGNPRTLLGRDAAICSPPSVCSSSSRGSLEGRDSTAATSDANEAGSTSLLGIPPVGVTASGLLGEGEAADSIVDVVEHSSSSSDQQTGPRPAAAGMHQLPKDPKDATGGEISEKIISTLENGRDAGAQGAGEIPVQVLQVPEMDVRDAEGLGIQDHDVVFWFGDLNYRIDSSISALDVLNHAQSRRLNFLAGNDQLNGARKAGDAFDGFHEGPIDFLPTYKYAVGTDEYDVRADKKFRAPAWCDRVLYWTATDEDDEGRGSADGGVSLLGYRRSETPSMSDHKPVSASFRLACKQIDSEIYRKVMTELIEEASASAGDRQPKVDVIDGGTTVDFGDVTYMVQEIRSAWIQNNGTLPAAFSAHSTVQNTRVLSRHEGRDNSPRERESTMDTSSSSSGRALARGGGAVDEGNIDSATQGKADRSVAGGGSGSAVAEQRRKDTELVGSKWYSVSPERGTLQPGEKLEITFSLLIQDPTARVLAGGRMSRKLHDILVLKVEDGNDRYMSVAGRYTSSAYGSSLEALVKAADADLTLDGKTSHPAVGNVDGRGVAELHGNSLVGTIRGWVAGENAARAPNDVASAGESAQTMVMLPPRQICRMVDALLHDGRYRQPGLFAEDGVEEEVRGIREAIDLGAEFPPHCTHSMVEALVTLLASLSPSIIPTSALLFGASAQPSPSSSNSGREYADVGTEAHRVMSRLPRLNSAVLVYLLSFFRSALECGVENGLTPDRLVNVQRFCLLPDEWREGGRESVPAPDAGGSGRDRVGREDDTVQIRGEGRGRRLAWAEGATGSSADSCRVGDDVGGVVEAVLRYFLMNER